MFLECGFFVFSSLTGAEGLWTKTLEKLENCRQDFLFFKWMISLVDDWMSLQTHTCIAELLDIFESVVSDLFFCSNSELNVWKWRNQWKECHRPLEMFGWRNLYSLYTRGTNQIEGKRLWYLVREQVDYKTRIDGMRVIVTSLNLI